MDWDGYPILRSPLRAHGAINPDAVGNKAHTTSAASSVVKSARCNPATLPTAPTRKRLATQEYHRDDM